MEALRPSSLTVSGLFGSLMRTALSSVPQTAPQLSPEVLAILGNVNDAVAAALSSRHECGLISGSKAEALADALEASIFFGIRPRASAAFEFETPHFFEAIESAAQVSKVSAELLERCRLCNFVHTAHGKCRFVVRLALVTRKISDLLKHLRGLWWPKSVCGDVRAVEALLAALEPLLRHQGSCLLDVMCDHPNMDRAFVAYDSCGVLRLINGSAGSRIEVTVAGSERALGAYDRATPSSFVGDVPGKEVIHQRGTWYIVHKQTRLYCARSNDQKSPPATGWRCLEGKLPRPVVRRLRPTPPVSAADAPDDKGVRVAAVFPVVMYRAPGAFVVHTRGTQVAVSVIDELDTRAAYLQAASRQRDHASVSSEETVATSWQLEVRQPTYAMPTDAIIWTEHRYRTRLEARKRDFVEALALRTMRTAEGDDAAVSRALAKHPKRHVETMSRYTLTEALAEARSAPLRAREAESARVLWRAAWRDGIRALMTNVSKEAFEIVEAETVGVAVVEKSCVVYSMRIGLERGIAFAEDSDDEDDAEADGRGYAARLLDSRLRRPRRVAVVRATLERLAQLGPGLDVPLMKGLESKLLKRAADFSPVGPALAALAAPAVRVVDAFLKSLRSSTSGTSLKLLVDEAVEDDDAVDVTLGVWQPLRSPNSASAEPPTTRAANINGKKVPLSFFKEDKLLAAQQYCCAGCGDPISVSMIGARNFAPCRLLDALLCKKRCHDDAHRLVPWRVALCADYTPHRVSRPAAAFLDDRAVEPLLKLSASIPIFKLDPRLDAARQLRTRLVELRRDSLDGRPGALHATRAIVQKLAPTRLYLALDPPDFWSLNDIRDATDPSPNGLIPFLSDLIADATLAFSQVFEDRCVLDARGSLDSLRYGATVPSAACVTSQDSEENSCVGGLSTDDDDDSPDDNSGDSRGSNCTSCSTGICHEDHAGMLS